ncbi:MAG: hypothetical protein JSV80_12025 [Acidobacteriota bacterium]|nr:MAG: hypothetical protein JSV80_12025 [Acidobacteriota bacterium]
MDRSKRHQLKHDEFVDGTMRVVQQLVDNPRPIIIGVAAIVVVVLVGWGFTAWSSTSKAERGRELARGLAALSAPIVEQEADAKPDDLYRPRYTSARARAEAASERLAELASASGKQGSLARALRGIALIEAGQPEAAAELLGRASNELAQDPTMGTLVQAAHARALEQLGRYDEAAAVWAALLDGDERYPRQLALEGQARTLEAKGDVAAARTAWQEIVDLYKDSPTAAAAREALARLD